MSEKKSDLWPEQQTITLKQYFKEREDLYDHLHPNYFKKNHRDHAMKEIWKLLGETYTVREISEKLRRLRTLYRKEKKKLEKAGIFNLEEQVKKSEWSLFSRLTFLNDSINCEKLYEPSDSEMKESSDFDHASVSNDVEHASISNNVDHTSISNDAHSPPSVSSLRIDSGLDLESDAERTAPRKSSVKANSETPFKVKRMKRKANDECFINYNERNVVQSCTKQATIDESVGHFSMFVRSQLKSIEDSKERNIAMLEITQILTNHLCPNFTFVTQVNE